MTELSQMFPGWALAAGDAPGPPVPPELVAQVRRLALEDWGQSVEAKRSHVQTLMDADLRLRAPRAFRLEPVRMEVRRHRLSATRSRLATRDPAPSKPSVLMNGTPAPGIERPRSSPWRRALGLVLLFALAGSVASAFGIGIDNGRASILGLGAALAIAGPWGAMKALGQVWASSRQALRAAVGGLYEAYLARKSHTLAGEIAEGEARATLAAAWCARCLDSLMATYDLEFLRGQQAARRATHAETPRVRQEGALS